MGGPTLKHSLILVTCDSGAGHLKREKRADHILTFDHRLVTGPVPTEGPAETFFQRQQALYEADGLYHEAWWFEAEDASGQSRLFKRVWTRLPDICREYERVELWIDPDPNAQLILLQLLDWLGHIPDIAPRLWLKQSESPLGERRPGDWVLPPYPIDQEDIALASRAWAAFGMPTPETWAALRHNQEINHLHGLKPAVERMLDELPDHTGLGATARRILGLVETEEWWAEAKRRGNDISDRRLTDEERRYSPLMKRILQSGPRPPLWHFEIGQTICDLGSATTPAIAGVTERLFNLDMHQDDQRFRRFRESALSLTELGRCLVDGTDDWSCHNPIQQWWGGTRLTNATLWRWDGGQDRLLAPS